MPSRVLVTGAAGFIGSHVVERLLGDGRHVIGLDSFDPFYPEAHKRRNLAEAARSGRFELIRGDIRDEDLVRHVFDDHAPDAVVHLAALAGVRPSLERPGVYADVNVHGSSVILDAAARHGRVPLVLASSSSVYGEREDGPFRETDPVERPISPYAATKRAMELVAHTFHHAHGLPIVCARIFTAYGPRQRPDLAIRKFADRMRAGEPIPIYGDGSALRDFTYVGDLVDGAARRPRDGPGLRDPQLRRRPQGLGARRREDARARARRARGDRLAAAPDRRRGPDLGGRVRRARSTRLRPAGPVRGRGAALRRVAPGGDVSAMRRALVTGGAGFIGGHLVERLLADGWHVRALDDLSSGRVANLAAVKDDVEFVEGDIRDARTVDAAVRGVEVVFHQAAVPSVPRSVAEPLRTNAVNVGGTLQVLESSRHAGVRRVVFAASSSAYGNTPTLPKVETMPGNPRSPYALQKYAGEVYCRLYHELYGLETVALRYFNVFGPRQDPRSQYAAVIPRFVTACLAEESPTVHGDGEQTRDFTMVADAVQANVLAADAPEAPGQVCNVAAGRRTSLNELMEHIRELTGASVDAVHGPPREGDVRDSLACLERSRAVLGYEPAVDLRDGLARTVEYFRSLEEKS